MKRVVPVLFLVSCLVSTAMAQSKTYKKYSDQKTVTKMEWRLNKVNQRLAHDGIFIEYDRKTSCFMITKLVHKSDILAKRTPDDLREAFLADSAHAESALGSEFPEFKRQGSRNLIMSFRLDDETSNELAVYKDKSLTLKDSYYEFVRENERQIH